jgi:hypothetical protein
MASTQQILDAELAAHNKCIRELTAQLGKEKAEAAAVVEAEAECQRQEAVRKAEAEAAAKQVESNATRRQEEATKKARVEVRKGKHKVDGPPVESSSARASGRAPCTLCVVAGEPCIPQSSHRVKACA